LKYITPDEYTRLIQCEHCKSLVLPDGIPVEDHYGISESFDFKSMPTLVITRRIECPNCGTYIILGKQTGEISHNEVIRLKEFERRQYR
jgi:DNA-directed RNA polymerase subunit RPC12/RpoP